jgi:mono/diheme cytochrome c family protein
MRLWPVLILLALIQPAHAEMAGDEYQTEAGGLSPEEREAARRSLADQIAAERARAEAAAARARQEKARLAAMRAARPEGERLIEARCQSCHDRRQIDAARFGPIGWNATILRMQVLNGAALQPGERQVIVAHLTAGSPERAAREWSLAAVSALVLAGALIGLRAWLKRRPRA